MSESGECVLLSSGEEEDEGKGTSALLHDRNTGATNTSAIDVEGLDDDTSDSDGSDCEIVRVDAVQGEEKWRNVEGSMSRLNHHLLRAGHNDPRVLLTQIFRLDRTLLPDDENQLWGLLLSLLSEPEPRHRLKHVNSLEKVIELLANAKHVLVVTGAGVSVSCGIPDFRSRNGIYARLSNDYPDLSSPQAMFDLAYFLQNPEPFFKFAKEIFPGQFTPSITHRFVALLEERGQLLRNYTQNIDTLEQAAGITRLIQCHGSFATASCTVCKHRVPSDQIKDAIFVQTIPRCPKCSGSSSAAGGQVVKPIEHGVINGYSTSGPSVAGGVMKPDIVFFGEDLSAEFHDTLAEDIKQADLVLVIGSSLKVRPVAHIPNAVPAHVPQVLINREPLSNHEFDVELLGDCDVIVRQLCLRLGWPVPSLPSSGDRTERDGQTLQFNYVPFTELSGCPMAFQSADDNNPPSSSEVAPTTSPAGEDARQAISTGSEPISIETVPKPKSPGSAGDHPVEITDSDDDDDDTKKEEEDDDTWEVTTSLPAGCFTIISSHQYVFPGAEVYVCKSVKPDLDGTEDDTETSSSTSSSSSVSSVHQIEEEHKPQSGTISDGVQGREALQQLLDICAQEQGHSTSSIPKNSVDTIRVNSDLDVDEVGRPSPHPVGEKAEQKTVGYTGNSVDRDASLSFTSSAPPATDSNHDNAVNGNDDEDGDEMVGCPNAEKRAKLCQPLAE